MNHEDWFGDSITFGVQISNFQGNLIVNSDEEIRIFSNKSVEIMVDDEFCSETCVHGSDDQEKVAGNVVSQVEDGKLLRKRVHCPI